MGVPEFIQEKKLFNFENGLLKYKNLELFVEVMKNCYILFYIQHF